MNRSLIMIVWTLKNKMKRVNTYILELVIILLLNTSCQIAPSTVNIGVCSSEDNDLYQVLQNNNQSVKRFDGIEKALEETQENGVLLILANDYPHKKTVIPKEFYKKAKKKKLTVYIEFPDRIPTGTTGEIKSTEKERLVVTSNFAGNELDSGDIIDAGLYRYMQVNERDSYIKGAKIAGFNQTVYGLDSIPNFPVLFEDDGVLVSTTKLSDFSKGRYAPKKNCEKLIKGILTHLSVEIDEDDIKWTPFVKPTYGPKKPLTTDAYANAVEKGVAWYEKARFLIHPSWKDYWQSIDIKSPPVGPPMDLSLPSGDGSLGVMEGHYSWIETDGRQHYRYWLRADCVAETAMTYAFVYTITEKQQYRDVATNLMDFLYNTETFMTPDSRNPNNTSYGLIGWADTKKSIYYGDDNARVILGSILASMKIQSKTWDKKITELILANFRTSGQNGFRTNALSGDKLGQTSWKELMARDIVNIAPHYESWLWATYLWLYDKTGYKPLLDKAKSAISITMENYPQNWKWTNGLQQERARMVLPLAWLVRVEDTQKHRDWLDQICKDLLQAQVRCGALQEELGIGGNGKYGAPKTNRHYGTTEAPVIHTNGDPVADMLYTSNFAFFALNEAAQATQDSKYIEAVDKLADFLVRIQSTSKTHRDLDGCWFRAFDYENWEYYGSNADHGWGAWGTLTGWTQSFITTTLALKLKGTSFWDVTKESSIGTGSSEIWEQMLPDIAH